MLLQINAIAYRSRRVNEMTRLSLFETLTLPILCYGCEGLHFTNKLLNNLNVCWSNVYRIVFGMLLSVFSGSVRDLIDFIRIVHNRKLKFYSRLCCSLMMLFHNVLIGFYIVMNLENYLGIMM